MTEYWESDDCSLIDGEMRIHGTGSEDYFNGGWYAVMDRWDNVMTFSKHIGNCKGRTYRRQIFPTRLSIQFPFPFPWINFIYVLFLFTDAI